MGLTLPFDSKPSDAIAEPFHNIVSPRYGIKSCLPDKYVIRHDVSPTYHQLWFEINATRDTHRFRLLVGLGQMHRRLKILVHHPLIKRLHSRNVRMGLGSSLTSANSRLLILSSTTIRCHLSPQLTETVLRSIYVATSISVTMNTSYACIALSIDTH